MGSIKMFPVKELREHFHDIVPVHPYAQLTTQRCDDISLFLRHASFVRHFSCGELGASWVRSRTAAQSGLRVWCFVSIVARTVEFDARRAKAPNSQASALICIGHVVNSTV